MAGRERETADMNSVLGRNIQELVDKRKEQQGTKSAQEKAAEAVSNFAGSMAFVYLHFAILVVWIIWNVGIIPGLKPWDPSFVMLASAASVEAIFLSTFVLITQNRMAANSDQRAELDLQINLLNEHETTRLIEMVLTLVERLDLETPADAELSQLRKNVNPREVMEEIQRSAEDADEAG